MLETIAIAYGLQITKEVCKLNNLSPIMVRVCSDCKTVVQYLNDEVEIRNPSSENAKDKILALKTLFPKVNFQWVRGHATNPYNHLADTIAYSIARG